VLALDQAQKVCPIPLPISATNIWIATYYHFQALGEYVRFEAPAEDCKEHVRSILTQHRERFEHLRGHFDEGEWREITPTNRPQIAIVGFRNGLSWFDVEHITNGVTMGGGPCIPQFWVDYDRGIFYYCLTD
jgi:hypothetical protein